MLSFNGSPGPARTTSYNVVLPFYTYAAFAFFAATLLMVFSPEDFINHYFQPHILAITHIMVLGFGTMIILGASHQLVPVLIEGELYSKQLALFSFLVAAAGIPVLSYGFYVFNMGWPAKWGGLLVVLAIIAYVINLAMSMHKSSQENVHAVFVLTASLWLLATASVGLLLVYNFSYPILSRNSVAYLSLHAHMGITGWFLLLIIGIGSRLIPMFMISKYNQPKILWWIYGLINAGLLLFVLIFIYGPGGWIWIFPVFPIGMALVLFGNYCYRSWQQRIRKKLDEQIKISLLSVLLVSLPLLFLIGIIIAIAMANEVQRSLVIAYGFIIIFGWIASIILGMTFKTLPFIVWNKVYHLKAGISKTPNPKDLFSAGIFKWMILFYIPGLVLFTAGILFREIIVLQLSAILLLFAAVLYNLNVIKVMMHKPVTL
jgi:hypothetical protein